MNAGLPVFGKFDFVLVVLIWGGLVGAGAETRKVARLNPLGLPEAPVVFKIEDGGDGGSKRSLRLVFEDSSGGARRAVGLTSSDYHYEEGGKEFAVDLWPAPAPRTAILLPGNVVLLTTGAAPGKNPLDFLSVGNPLYVGFFDWREGSVEAVGRGAFLSISPDPKHPAVVLVESYLPREAPPKRALTSDPIFYYWTPGSSDPQGLASRTPWETSLPIAYPRGRGKQLPAALGGRRLLGKPAWSPTGSRLALVAYETKSKRAELVVINFAEGRPGYFSQDVPAAEHSLVERMIAEDKVGYWGEAAKGISLRWVDGENLSIVFDGERSYPVAVGDFR